MEYTPDIITKLKDNEVFVFGSNESGIHGGGAARLAYDKFGAEWGQGFGHTGSTFAIPTKDWSIQTLPIGVIGLYVGRFLAYAKQKPKLKFLVTKIGCGLAGLTPYEVAPMFYAWGKVPSNIILPKDFELEKLVQEAGKKYVDAGGKIS